MTIRPCLSHGTDDDKDYTIADMAAIGSEYLRQQGIKITAKELLGQREWGHLFSSFWHAVEKNPALYKGRTLTEGDIFKYGNRIFICHKGIIECYVGENPPKVIMEAPRYFALLAELDRTALKE